MRELIDNRFQSKFSCSLIIDVVKNIQVYQNLVQIMQHNTITLDTVDCLKQTLFQTLERLKVIPGLFRFIFSDTSLIRTIRQLVPLFKLLGPMLSANTHKFVQINDMIENPHNFTSFVQQRRNITGINQWYFNTRLVSIAECERFSTSRAALSPRVDWMRRAILSISSVNGIK